MEITKADDIGTKWPALVPSEDEDSRNHKQPLYVRMNSHEGSNVVDIINSASVRKHSFSSVVSMTKQEEPPRWLILTLLICTTTLCFGNYYVYDFPQALQTPFHDKLKLGPKDTNLFYAAYGLPNTVLTFFGGLFITVMGDRVALLTFITQIVVGQAVFGIGTVMDNYWVMFAGRVIFGMGGENNLVVQCFVVEKWFSGRIISIAFGMVMMSNLAGTMANNFQTPLSYELLGGNFGSVFLYSFFALSLSVLSAQTYVVLDCKYRDKYIALEHETGSKDKKEKTFCESFKEISWTFWAIMFAQLTASNVYYQFMNFGTSYTQIKFGNTYSVSKNYLTLIPFVILICMLIFSTFTEKFGQKGKMLMVAGWLSLITTSMLYFYPSDCGLWLMQPYICFALWFSIYSAAMWPSIPQTVPRKMMGFAYGLINAANNIGLALYPFIFGAINDSNTPEAYDNSMIGQMILSALGVIGTTGAYICAKKYDGNKLDDLNAHTEKMKDIKEQVDAELSMKKSSFAELPSTTKISSQTQNLRTGSMDY